MNNFSPLYMKQREKYSFKQGKGSSMNDVHNFPQNMTSFNTKCIRDLDSTLVKSSEIIMVYGEGGGGQLSYHRSMGLLSEIGSALKLKHNF